MTSAYFALILREHGRNATARAALLEGTDLRSATEMPVEITLGQQLRQIRNANRMLGPGWALAMASRFHAATHGPIGVGAVSAPTVRQGVEVMTRYSRVRSPHFRLRAALAGNELRLVPEECVELTDEERRALLDIVMASTQALVESLLGRAASEARFELHYGAPGDTPYAAAFHGAVSFGHAESAVVIPAGWLELESPLAGPALLAAALETLTAGERRLDGDATFVARAEQLIAANGVRPESDALARRMRVSRRTLVRRLRDGGTSFRELRETALKRRALSLLRDPELSVAEVAYALGYDEPANFGRACRRWFGMAPGRLRRVLLEAPANPT